MKYIRTKDGRIGFVSSVKDYNGGKPTHFFVRFNNDNEVYGCEELDIITQADTIEELCDEAVFFDKDNVPHYKSKEGNVWYLGASLFTESLRFGIFTDKGLIYVAKMNDKGELELL